MSNIGKKAKLFVLIGTTLVTGLIQGCAQQGYSVIAFTSTIIGVEISQNPATQAPQAKLGYNRAEFAFVPTNRDAGKISGNGNKGGGATDTANVLMELRYGGIFDLGASSGIYQRLAVGDIAVKQNGAAAMFIKNADGDVDENAANALRAIKRVPTVNADVVAEKAIIVAKFMQFIDSNDAASLAKFNAVAIAKGYPKTINSYVDYPAFRDFSSYPHTSIDEVRTIRSALEKQGITF